MSCLAFPNRDRELTIGTPGIYVKRFVSIIISIGQQPEYGVRPHFVVREGLLLFIVVHEDLLLFCCYC